LLFFAEYFSASQIKEKEMGEACSTRERFEKCSLKFQVVNPREDYRKPKSKPRIKGPELFATLL
jgi:hypothetical protein